MDGKGRYSDNVLVEPLWRTVKYEEVYLKAYEGGREARTGMDAYFHFYNTQRPHQALDYRTPADVYGSTEMRPAQDLPEKRWWYATPGQQQPLLMLPLSCPNEWVHQKEPVCEFILNR